MSLAFRKSFVLKLCSFPNVILQESLLIFYDKKYPAQVPPAASPFKPAKEIFPSFLFLTICLSSRLFTSHVLSC